MRVKKENRKGNVIKRLLVNLVLIALGIVAGLILVEIVFRGLDLPPFSTNLRPRNMFKIDEEIGFILNPEWQGFLSDLEFKTEIKINTDGIRDHDHDPSFEGSKILGAGDSFVWGHGVKLEETFLSKLEKLTGAETIKAGVESYSLKQDFLMMKRMVDKYHPKIIILGFYLGNDFGDDIVKHLPTVKDGYLVSWDERNWDLSNQSPAQIKKQEPLELENWSNFKVYKFLEYKFIQLGIIANPFLPSTSVEVKDCPWPVHPEFLSKNFPNNSETGKLQWETTKSTFLEIKKWVDQKDMDMIVLIIPDKIQVDDKIWQFLAANCENFKKQEEFNRFRANKLLANFFSGFGIRYIDLLPVFRKQKDIDRLYFRKDPHLTKHGHRIAAETIYHYLLMENLLPN